MPHSTTFEVYADGEPDEINERLLAYLERERVNLCGRFQPSPVPHFAVCEIAVTSRALAHDPQQVATWVADIALG